MKFINERIYGVDRIKMALHKCLSSKYYLRRNNETYCNLFVYDFLLSFDLQKPLWNEKEKRIMLANEMYEVLSNNYIRIPIKETLQPTDNIFIACCKGKEHGHIAIIYPSNTKVFSNKWNTNCPLVANVGLVNGIMGLNWAFQDIPDIFMYANISDIDRDI